MSTWSPWGTVDDVHPIAEGVVSLSTPGHGGIRVRVEVLEACLTPSQLAYCRGLPYSSVGDVFAYFEEDCDALIPILKVPGVWSVCTCDRATAEQAFKFWHPKWPEV